jgi:hypothetical protein
VRCWGSGAGAAGVRFLCPCPASRRCSLFFRLRTIGGLDWAQPASYLHVLLLSTWWKARQAMYACMYLTYTGIIRAYYIPIAHRLMDFRRLCTRHRFFVDAD